MKIPKSITIQGVKISVREYDKIPSNTNDGYADVSGCAIWLEAGLQDDYREHVFFHEVVHFMAAHVDADLSEAQVDGMAAMMREVFGQLK